MHVFSLIATILVLGLGAQAFIAIPGARTLASNSNIVAKRALGPTDRISGFWGKPVAQFQQPQSRRLTPLRDLLGLGPAEIAISLVVALVLFGPETLKSLSKDVGRAAAELKEIPKTFKEGMEEGAESTQVAKMKAIAAEKRKKRDAKLAEEGGDIGDEEAEDA